jgi:hypothetical protein
VTSPLIAADAEFEKARARMTAVYIDMAKAVQINLLGEALKNEVCPWCDEDFAGYGDLTYYWTNHVILECPKRPQA